MSVFDYGEHGGVCYYAMQYIAGQSLDKVLEDIRRLRNEREALSTDNAETLPCDLDRRHEHADEDEAPRDTNSLRRTVTLGLLTGAFSAGCRFRALRHSRHSSSFRRKPRTRDGRSGARCGGAALGV